MSTSNQFANNERRHQTYQLIAKLKNERHDVWTSYCEIVQKKPFPVNAQMKRELVKFSQLLIDYISLGHFGVYERLMSGNERRDRVLNAAKEIYPDLSVTTDAAVSFNDKYDHVEEIDEFSDLEQDLSVLGESLAIRIDLEDKFCQLMM
jgi:regulator of sigma D